MPCKVSFFYNQYNSGWSETYYTLIDDPTAVVDSLTNTFLKNSCSFRSAATFLKAVRVTRIGGARYSVLHRPYPAVQGQRGGTDDGPDVASTDAVFMLRGPAGATRRVFFRGFADNDVIRDGYGNDLLSTAIKKGVDLFCAGMISYGFQIRYQQRPAAGGLVWQAVKSVYKDPANNFLTRFYTTPRLPDHAVGDVLAFSGINSRILPGFPRKVQIYDVHALAGGAPEYTIAYALPGGEGLLTKTLKCTKYQTAYDPISAWTFERYSEHKTGRPFGSLRGRARARG